MDFAKRTIDIARTSVTEGGLPFGTVIVKDGEILAESRNRVPETHDPTDHAEILAIRDTCRKLCTEHLTGCTIYASPIRARCVWGRCITAHPTRSFFSPPARLPRRAWRAAKTSTSNPSTFYGEFAKPWDQRRLPMRYANTREQRSWWH